MSRSRFPMPTPHGWYAVARSSEVPPRTAIPLRYFELDFVLFRGESGTPYILDAHCPHLGAHLGYGGKVSSDSISCPFHGWQFNHWGGCELAPHAKKTPTHGSMQNWACEEVHETIFVYFGRSSPQWRPLPFDHSDANKWSGQIDYRLQIKSHPQEIAENLVDRAHFTVVHGARSLPSTKVQLRDHTLVADSSMRVKAPWGEADARIIATLFGLGFSLVEFSGIVNLLLLTTITPIEGELLDVRLLFRIDPSQGFSLESGLGRAFAEDVIRQVEEDRVIWENKCYHAAPVLSSEDVHIPTLRKWARQFYETERQPSESPPPVANTTVAQDA